MKVILAINQLNAQNLLL